MRNVCLLLVLVCCGRADVTLAPLFQDHAVLQQGKPLPVWGRAEAGERVTVAFAGQLVQATAGDDGRWLVLLEPLNASATPAEMIVTGKNTLTVSDLLVGEVWLCSGQSNMEWPVRLSLQAEAEIAAATNPMIRHFKVEHALAETPVDTARGSWDVCSPASVGEFTAVGYFFARDLQPRLNVPIGLINASWSGTPIEGWMSPGALATSSHHQAVSERWLQAMADFPELQADYEAALARWKASAEAAKARGVAFSEPRPNAPRGPNHSSRPSGLFNGMIHPLIPYALRGMLWYQGEANASRAHEYAALFRELIVSWRRHFAQPDLPFFWVQLANFKAEDGTGLSWAQLREAQATALALPNTGQAVAIDIGEPNDIHPRNKQEVGRRLALLARAKVYGKHVDFTGPVFSSATPEGSSLRVRFRGPSTGLLARNKPLQSFQVAGADRQFHPATARIDGETLIVSAREVPQPVAVRYAWSNAPEANLFNSAGLPAAPFRSDNW